MWQTVGISGCKRVRFEKFFLITGGILFSLAIGRQNRVYTYGDAITKVVSWEGGKRASPGLIIQAEAIL